MIICIAGTAFGERDNNVQRVQFERGEKSATVESYLSGYATTDYLLRAYRGQYMDVSMATDNSSNYFNILTPGEENTALFNGSVKGNQYQGILPATGDYRIRIYMMRNAARRNETAHYRLEMLIATAEKNMATPGVDQTAINSASRASQGDFDATGQLPCAQHSGQPTSPCNFGVSREGRGTATVVIIRPDGKKRAIFFIDGRPNSADTCEADGYGELKARRENDIHLIRVGEERYEIPDAVITGG